MEVPGVGRFALFEDPDGRVMGIWEQQRKPSPSRCLQRGPGNRAVVAVSGNPFAARLHGQRGEVGVGDEVASGGAALAQGAEQVPMPTPGSDGHRVRASAERSANANASSVVLGWRKIRGCVAMRTKAPSTSSGSRCAVCSAAEAAARRCRDAPFSGGILRWTRRRTLPYYVTHPASLYAAAATTALSAVPQAMSTTATTVGNPRASARFVRS